MWTALSLSSNIYDVIFTPQMSFVFCLFHELGPQISSQIIQQSIPIDNTYLHRIYNDSLEAPPPTADDERVGRLQHTFMPTMLLDADLKGKNPSTSLDSVNRLSPIHSELSNKNNKTRRNSH